EAISELRSEDAEVEDLGLHKSALVFLQQLQARNLDTKLAKLGQASEKPPTERIWDIARLNIQHLISAIPRTVVEQDGQQEGDVQNDLLQGAAVFPEQKRSESKGQGPQVVVEAWSPRRQVNVDMSMNADNFLWRTTTKEMNSPRILQGATESKERIENNEGAGGVMEESVHEAPIDASETAAQEGASVNTLVNLEEHNEETTSEQHVDEAPGACVQEGAMDGRSSETEMKSKLSGENHGTLCLPKVGDIQKLDAPPGDLAAPGDPLQVVLRNELRICQDVLDRVHTDMRRVLDAIDGHGALDEDTFKLMTELSRWELPWRDCSGPLDCECMDNWVQDLVNQAFFLKGCVGRGLPRIVPIGLLFQPEAYLHAVRQEFSMMAGVPMSCVHFECEVLEGDGLDVPVEEGSVEGDQGASWDKPIAPLRTSDCGLCVSGIVIQGKTRPEAHCNARNLS
ncbi:unnamed protein product, partial [Ostreobium quekettii]